MEKSLIFKTTFKTRKWRRQFVFFRRCHRRASGASYCDVGNCQYMLFLIISFGFCKRESSSLFFVGFIVVVEEIYTSVACDFGDIWAYNACFLQLADCCFSCTMIRKLFFSLASRLWIVFIVLLMVFSLFRLVWTRCLSLKFRFRLILWYKEPDLRMFSKTGLRSTKNLKTAAGHLSPPTDNTRGLKSLGPVVRTPVSAKPELNFNPGFFFFLFIKSTLSDNFLYFFSISNHQIVGKENSTELAF